MSLLTIIGARPQFIKAAVVSKALTEAGLHEQIVHTGQHYDYQMSSVFWEELNLPVPTVNLNVGSGLHGQQTGLMLQKIEAFILDLPEKPKALMVYGDTNSTLAGALVASKLNIPVVHIEAGLRSFNREMPEEINRVLTDHISDYLFCSSKKGVDQLATEGITKDVYDVGDVMYDALITFSEVAKQKFSLEEIIPFDAGTYYLATIHRPSNTDNSENLTEIIKAFGKLKKNVVWPVHPRNKKKIEDLDIPENLHLMDPISYFKMMVLLNNCAKVITDSGGLQKEAYWMKKPCVTIRDETEWTETLRGNWNQIVGPNSQKIIHAVNISPSEQWKNLYGNGQSAQAIATELVRYFSIKSG